MAQVKVQTSAHTVPSINGTVPTVPPAPPQDNMANPKEKTPMCLVNELARFNRIQPQYKLLNERGPAHAKIFTVQLCLGEQVWEAEGSSIKKAQHSTANKALAESLLPRPPPRITKPDTHTNPGSITPTVELNGLAMKRGEPAVYRPLEPKPLHNYRANYNFRGIFNQRYHYPVPKVFYVQLTVGSNEFIGEGRTRQAARHNAAMKALQALRNEPIPEKQPQSLEEKKGSEEDSDVNKSEISLVYEIALKRNMPVNFEVLKESGPPHMKSFLTRVTVGEFSAEGEGNSKKLSKKRAAFSILQELKKLPFIPVVEKPKVHYKKRPKTILKVKVGDEVTSGTGSNKKVAKRAAAEAMLLHLGYRASTPIQNTQEKPHMDNKSWNGQRATFPEASTNTQKGILHLSPDVYQEMEASRNKGGTAPSVTPMTPVTYLNPKEVSQAPFYNNSASKTAAIARELLSKTPKTPAIPCSSVQPSQQLEYLAHIQGFQVQYTDRQTDTEFVTYLTLSPVQMTFHGIGSSIQASHDQLLFERWLMELCHTRPLVLQAALSALKQLSEQGLDPVDGGVKVENGSCEISVKHPDGKQTNSGSQDCADPNAVV
ncbi:double-stranded RNA-binding protein Staufen homolog 2 isoform X5 [Neoarius graeffei]|uniref:double-stranded RNA-binding protein Staufen homolog 2 isoform X5 n=1 Tax=Neoarius graeffei TaxID=443677 RepID=UPI00298CCA96|nr:double-stranded RNA-binding protein Staufen homolog 2 isoform X5 [Neoarius graeffei]